MAEGPGPAFNGISGLPIVKPPYGVLAAIDLNSGDMKWRVPHGETPDAIRNSPALAGLTIPKTGQQGSVGLMVTTSLVVVGDPQVTSPPERARGAMLRAYKKRCFARTVKQTGAEVGAVLMPRPEQVTDDLLSGLLSRAGVSLKAQLLRLAGHSSPCHACVRVIIARPFPEVLESVRS